MSEFNFIRPIKLAFLLMLSVCSFVIPSYASVEVNFSGTLRGNPPCDIIGADVDFEDIGVTKIDGINYKKDLELTVTCAADTGSLFISYSGMSADSFDPKALQTSVAGLGIRLYYNGDVIEPDNNDIPITIPDDQPVTINLTAVPVKNPSPSFILLEQSFTAIGTVEVRYP